MTRMKWFLYSSLINSRQVIWSNKYQLRKCLIQVSVRFDYQCCPFTVQYNMGHMALSALESPTSLSLCIVVHRSLPLASRDFMIRRINVRSHQESTVRYIRVWRFTVIVKMFNLRVSRSYDKAPCRPLVKTSQNTNIYMELIMTFPISLTISV